MSDTGVENRAEDVKPVFARRGPRQVLTVSLLAVDNVREEVSTSRSELDLLDETHLARKRAVGLLLHESVLSTLPGTAQSDILWARGKPDECDRNSSHC